MELDSFLAHYGIKGMRWGVRRNLDSSGHVQKSAAEAAGTPDIVKGGHAAPSVHTKGGLDGNVNTSADAERATKAYVKARTRGISSLSNEELKAITNRVKAEKEFHQLSSDQKSELQKKVDELRLMQDYRKLSAAEAEAKKSTGRKIIDSVLSSAVKTANEQAAAYGQQIIKDMLSQTGTKKSDVGLRKPNGPFRVNPDKVRFHPGTRGGTSPALNR